MMIWNSGLLFRGTLYVLNSTSG